LPCANGSPQYNASRSRHAGGVQAVMGDGSVRFVQDSVTPLTWSRMGSSLDGLPLGNDF
jgi:prepilin-type processing-associated H-X9-DG protein